MSQFPGEMAVVERALDEAKRAANQAVNQAEDFLLEHREKVARDGYTVTLLHDLLRPCYIPAISLLLLVAELSFEWLTSHVHHVHHVTAM